MNSGGDFVGSVNVRVVPVLDQDALRAESARLKAAMEAAQNSVNAGMVSSVNAQQAVNTAQASSAQSLNDVLLAHQAVTQAAVGAGKRPSISPSSIQIRDAIDIFEMPSSTGEFAPHVIRNASQAWSQFPSILGEWRDKNASEHDVIRTQNLRPGHEFMMGGTKFITERDDKGGISIRGNDRSSVISPDVYPHLAIDRGSLSHPEYGDLDGSPMKIRVDTSEAMAEIKALRAEIERARDAAETPIVITSSARGERTRNNPLLPDIIDDSGDVINPNIPRAARSRRHPTTEEGRDALEFASMVDEDLMTRELEAEADRFRQQRLDRQNAQRHRSTGRPSEGKRESILMSPVGGRAGTGLMMSFMFGGWELFGAYQAAAMMDSAMGTPSEIAQQQLAAVQQMRSGPLGSIAGMIVEPFDSTGSYVTGTLASAEAGEKFGELKIGMQRQAAEMRITRSIMGSPKAARDILGLYNKERIDVGAMEESKTAEMKAVAAQEAQGEMKIAESEFAVQRWFASFMGGLIDVASGPADGAQVRSDFEQWLGWSDRRLEAGRWAQNNAKLLKKQFDPLKAKLKGEMQGMTDAMATEMVEGIHEGMRLDISGLGINSASAESIARIRQPINDLWGQIDASMKRGGPARERDQMRAAIWAMTPTANFTEDMAAADKQFEKDVKEYGRFEARDRQLNKHREIWKTYLPLDNRAEQIPDVMADIDLDQQQNRFIEASTVGSHKIQIESIKASGTLDQFDDEWAMISEDAEATAALGIDDPVKKQQHHEKFEAMRGSHKARKERFTRNLSRSYDDQAAVYDVAMERGTEAANVEAEYLKIQNEVNDLYEANLPVQAAKRLSVGKKEMEYMEDQFYESFRPFVASPLYTGFSQTAGRGGAEYEDARRRLDELGNSYSGRGGGGAVGQDNGEAVQSLQSIERSNEALLRAVEHLEQTISSFVGGAL